MVIHRVSSDFSKVDSWELPMDVTHCTFVEVCEFLLEINPAQGSWFSKFLFVVRAVAGGILGWDNKESWLPIPGTTDLSIRDRLTEEELSLDASGTHPLIRELGGEFRVAYLFEKEALLEISNKTVFALIHLHGDGLSKVRMVIYVKVRGWLGRAYMAAIMPFRHMVVYPAWFRLMEREWAARSSPKN